MLFFNKSGAMLLFVPVSNIRNFIGERKSSGFISQNVKIIAMKSGIILSLIGGVLLSSCSVYRNGQTPDDVYYSPARQTQSAAVAAGSNGYVQTQSGRNDGKRYNDYSNSRSYSAYDDFATMDDRWLMMRVRNPYRWSMFDDYSYYNAFSPYSPYSPYGMGGFYSPYSPMYGSGWSFGLGFGSYSPWGFGGLGYGYYNNYCNWNNYYNPYYPGVIIVDPKTNPAGYTRARSFNLNSYNNFNSRTGVVRPQYNNTNSNRIRYNNSNNSTLGGSQRRYSNGNGSDYYRSPSNNSSPSRNYSPSYNNTPSYSPNSSGSSGGSYGGGNSGGGGGAGSRPSRR